MPKDPRKYVAESRDLSKIAPKLREYALEIVHEMEMDGFDPLLFEAVRTKERQWWIFGTGRDAKTLTDLKIPAEYAWVTSGYRASNASSHLVSVHGHGLALDCISKSKLWNAPEGFWTALGAAVKKRGLTWGGAWKSPVDFPHFQWALKRNGTIYAGPSAVDRLRTEKEGMEATWTFYKATT